MKATTTAIISDRSESIVIMRGSSDLDAQTVRLVDLAQRPIQRMTIGGDVVLITLIVLGEHDMDIKRGDKFWVGTAPFSAADDDLYEILGPRPGEAIKTAAEATLIT